MSHSYIAGVSQTNKFPEMSILTVKNKKTFLKKLRNWGGNRFCIILPFEYFLEFDVVRLITKILN